MGFLDSGQQRASSLILVLGLGLLLVLAPYLSGLIGALVLYVILAPVQGLLVRWLPARAAAGVGVILALLGIVLPTAVFAGIVVDQAPGIANGLARSPLLDRLAQVSVAGMPVGTRLAGVGEELLGWLGAGAIGLLGTATRIGLNLAIALFILYYLLLRPGESWQSVKPYIPFTPASAELLRQRFRDVTVSTVVGTGLVAVIQGVLVAMAFWLTGLQNPLFWGVVTVVFAILPVVGSGLVWGPGALSLFLDDRYGAGLVLTAIGVVVVSNIDLVVRPLVFRRFAQIHPLVTLVGAVGGVSYFGLLGILVGPLAVSYFFELIRIYRAEYLPEPDAAVPRPSGPAPPASPAVPSPATGASA